MSDITVAVIFSFSALAMSFVIIKSIPIEATRTLSYTAIGLLCAHILGIKITAPIEPHIADKLGIAVIVWLIAATLAVCIRGLRGPVNDKPTALNGS